MYVHQVYYIYTLNAFYVILSASQSIHAYTDRHIVDAIWPAEYIAQRSHCNMTCWIWDVKSQVENIERMTSYNLIFAGKNHIFWCFSFCRPMAYSQEAAAPISTVPLGERLLAMVESLQETEATV